MKNFRWNSEKPMATTGVDAPHRFRHVEPLASVCDYGQAVVGWATPSATGINGRPRGLEGRGTG